MIEESALLNDFLFQDCLEPCKWALEVNPAKGCVAQAMLTVQKRVISLWVREAKSYTGQVNTVPSIDWFNEGVETNMEQS